jgi:hypothetical protein
MDSLCKAQHWPIEQFKDCLNENFEEIASDAISSLLSFALIGSELQWTKTIICPLIDRISKGSCIESFHCSNRDYDCLRDAPRIESLDQLGYPPKTSLNYFNAMCRIGFTSEFALDMVDSVEDLDEFDHLPPWLVSSMACFVESAIFSDFHPSFVDSPLVSAHIRTVLRPSFAEALEYSYSSLGHSENEILSDWKSMAWKASQCATSSTKVPNSDGLISTTNTEMGKPTQC